METHGSERRIIALASHKGGTGKTTTALNLGAILGEKGKKTLLVDIDPQANLTMGLGINIAENDPTIYDVLLNPERGLELAVRQTNLPNLFIVPSSLNLVGAEVELAGKSERQWLLKKSMQEIIAAYDFVIIDTPPSLGLYTQNAFIACYELIVPLQVHVFALKSVAQLHTTISVLRKQQNPRLHISGLVCTMYDARNSLSRVIAETIRQDLGEVVFKTMIPMNIALAEAPAAGQPITIYAPNSPGAKAYRDLTEEVLASGKTE